MRSRGRQPSHHRGAGDQESDQQHRQRSSFAEQKRRNQHQRSLDAQLKREPRGQARKKRPAPEREVHGGEMRREHQRIGFLGNNSGSQVENRKKGQRRSRQIAFQARPQRRRQKVRKRAAQANEDGVRQAQRDTGPGSEGQVERQIQGGFVIPEVAIRKLAGKNLNRGGKMIVLIGPQNVDVAQSRCQDRGGKAQPETHARQFLITA